MKVYKKWSGFQKIYYEGISKLSDIFLVLKIAVPILCVSFDIQQKERVTSHKFTVLPSAYVLNTPGTRVGSMLLWPNAGRKKQKKHLKIWGQTKCRLPDYHRIGWNALSGRRRKKKRQVSENNGQLSSAEVAWTNS